MDVHLRDRMPSINLILLMFVVLFFIIKEIGWYGQALDC